MLEVNRRSTLFNDLTDDGTKIRLNFQLASQRQASVDEPLPPETVASVQALVQSLRDQQITVTRLQESLFSQILPRGRLLSSNSNANDTNAFSRQTNANYMTAQTFEETKEEDEVEEASRRHDPSLDELYLQRQQLQVARKLILKQKDEMIILVRKMREMNSELAKLKASEVTQICGQLNQQSQFMQSEAACQTDFIASKKQSLFQSSIEPQMDNEKALNDFDWLRNQQKHEKLQCDEEKGFSFQQESSLQTLSLPIKTPACKQQINTNFDDTRVGEAIIINTQSESSKQQLTVQSLKSSSDAQNRLIYIDERQSKESDSKENENVSPSISSVSPDCKRYRPNPQ